MIARILAVLILTGFCGTAAAETVTVATYNIENFRRHFMANRLATSEPPLPQDERVKELLDELKRYNDKNNWMIATVIQAPEFDPDILLIQEGCSQEDLEFFNKRWLNEAYETVITFQTNTNRDQHLNLMMKPGFKVIERRDEFYKEIDSVPNPVGERLFARGPGFVLVETPGGFRFWVGTTHQKSKSGNSIEATRWRNREAVRTHEILRELRDGDPYPVMLLGDINDEIGIQEFEMDGGGDTVANLVGPPGGGFLLATAQLSEAGKITYGGYWNARFRSLIDHIVISEDLKDRVSEVRVYNTRLAAAASDHYPVIIRIRDGKNSQE